MRLVDEPLATALDEREAVPEEVLGFGRKGLRPSRDVRRTGELPVDMVRVGVLDLPVRHRQDLVEVAVAVGLRTFLYKTPSGVVGVLCRHAVCRR